MQILKHPRFLIVLRVVIGAILIYAGFKKAIAPQEFADSIVSFKAVPSQLVNLMALGLPITECIVGGFLMTGWQKRLAAFSALILSMIFALALAQALARGLSVDCGCFGSGTPSLGKTWLSLGRDILLLSATACLYRQSLSYATEQPNSN